MNKLFLLVVLTGVLCGHADSHKGKCLKMFGKMNFDHEKFSGDWYVVAKAVSSAVPKMQSTCNKLSYSAKDEGNTTHVNVQFTMKTDDKPVVFIAKGQPYFSKMDSVIQAVWKKESEDKWMAVYTQSILATDYEQFAVLYACHPVYNEKEDMFDKFELVQILSRKLDMDSTLLSVLKNVLTGFDYNMDDIIVPDNTNC